MLCTPVTLTYFLAVYGLWSTAFYGSVRLSMAPLALFGYLVF